MPAPALEEAVEDLRECLLVARDQLVREGVSERVWCMIDRRLDRVIELLPEELPGR